MTVSLISSPSSPTKKSATHLLHLCSCSGLSLPMPVCAVARPRTRASRANVHKRAKPAPLTTWPWGHTSIVGARQNAAPLNYTISADVQSNSKCDSGALASVKNDLKLPTPVIYLPHPGANDLNCWSAVKQQLCPWPNYTPLCRPRPFTNFCGCAILSCNLQPTGSS